jgi:hypothetical protein
MLPTVVREITPPFSWETKEGGSWPSSEGLKMDLRLVTLILTLGSWPRVCTGAGWATLINSKAEVINKPEMYMVNEREELNGIQEKKKVEREVKK